MRENLRQLDFELLLAINQGWQAPWLDSLMIFLSHAWVWIVVAAFFIARAYRHKDWQFVKMCGLMILATIIVDAIAYHLLKPYLGRFRPCLEFAESVRKVYGCGGRFSFPSNHATNGAVIATMVWLFKGWRWGAFWWGVVILIGVSRIYLGVHYPGDILAGFLFGGLAGFFAVVAVKSVRGWRDFFQLP